MNGPAPEVGTPSIVNHAHKPPTGAPWWERCQCGLSAAAHVATAVDMRDLPPLPYRSPDQVVRGSVPSHTEQPGWRS